MPIDSKLTRRKFAVATGAFLYLPLTKPFTKCARAAVADSGPTAESAYVWGLPLVLYSRYQALAAGYPKNQFTLSTRLSNPDDKVAGPNTDTLYGFGFLDLTAEPLLLHVPATGNRYYSIHLIDAYQNTFAYVGRRATGTQEGEYAITAPGWKGKLPHGVTAIESPTPHVMALTRTLVRGSHDLPEAQSIQLKYTLRPLSAYASVAQPPRTTNAAFNVFPFIDLSTNGAKTFDELNAALELDPPSVHEKIPAAKFASVGIGAGKKISNPAELETVAANAYRRIREADYSTKVNGWKVNYKVTNFIQDPLFRASANRVGPGVHIAEEALYFGAVADRDGQPLTGANRYRITFPAQGLPPVDAFWSLILYGADFFLVSNPINRYSISDRTENPVRNSDGSLQVLIQRDEPKRDKPEDRLGNWLPSPEGSFSLVLRTYQPRPEVLNGKYQPPSIERV
jgi:hypothetical protein